MDSLKKAEIIADHLFEDVMTMLEEDGAAKERIGTEVMALNAMLNLVKTELGAGTKE